MAMIDYGALLRVDGEFVNKNDNLFMNVSDTGYMCEHAFYPDGEECRLNGNYYAYAGDEGLMLCFYKSSIVIVKKEKVVKYFYDFPFASEEFWLDGIGLKLKVSHLDKKWLEEPFSYSNYNFKEYIEESYLISADELKEKYPSTYYREKKIFRRLMVWYSHHKYSYKYRTARWIAEWEYKGKKYEVIFGYGIDPVEEVWDAIKNKYYDFTDLEREKIDEWFKEDK